MEKYVKVQPFWKLNHKFLNALKLFNKVMVLPAIEIRPWNKTMKNIKRFPVNSWEGNIQITFLWLNWEYSITILKLNYKWIKFNNRW